MYVAIYQLEEYTKDNRKIYAKLYVAIHNKE